MILLFFLLILVESGYSQVPDNPQHLGCERIYGNFNGMRTVFKRPMEPGDKLVINGSASFIGKTIRINIHNTIAPLGFPIHVRSDFGGYMHYSAFLNGGWGPAEYGPQPYVRGQNYLLTIEYTGFSFNVYSGQSLIKSFALRSPTWFQLGATDLYGDHVSYWMEMICKNPPVTIPPRTTRRPGRGNGGGNGQGGRGGRGHGGRGHGHGDGSSSSSSSEEC